MGCRLLGITVAALLGAAAHAAQATPVVIANPAGSFTPALASATVLTFDNVALGPLPSYNFAGGKLTGDGGIEDTTTGTYAEPFGDATNYLTVSLNKASGSTLLDLTLPENYFGLFWGSIDSYNSILFLMNGVPVGQFSGTDIATLTGLTANGGQTLTASNRYINFDFGNTLFDQVELSTTNFAFEVDDIAFGDPAPENVPEPPSLPLLLIPLGSLALLRRPRTARDLSA